MHELRTVAANVIGRVLFGDGTKFAKTTIYDEYTSC